MDPPVIVGGQVPAILDLTFFFGPARFQLQPFRTNPTVGRLQNLFAARRIQLVMMPIAGAQQAVLQIPNVGQLMQHGILNMGLNANDLRLLQSLLGLQQVDAQGLDIAFSLRQGNVTRHYRNPDRTVRAIDIYNAAADVPSNVVYAATHEKVNCVPSSVNVFRGRGIGIDHQGQVCARAFAACIRPEVNLAGGPVSFPPGPDFLGDAPAGFGIPPKPAGANQPIADLMQMAAAVHDRAHQAVGRGTDTAPIDRSCSFRLGRQVKDDPTVAGGPIRAIMGAADAMTNLKAYIVIWNSLVGVYNGNKLFLFSEKAKFFRQPNRAFVASNKHIAGSQYLDAICLILADEFLLSPIGRRNYSDQFRAFFRDIPKWFVRSIVKEFCASASALQATARKNQQPLPNNMRYLRCREGKPALGMAPAGKKPARSSFTVMHTVQQCSCVLDYFGLPHMCTIERNCLADLRQPSYLPQGLSLKVVVDIVKGMITIHIPFLRNIVAAGQRPPVVHQGFAAPTIVKPGFVLPTRWHQDDADKEAQRGGMNRTMAGVDPGVTIPVTVVSVPINVEAPPNGPPNPAPLLGSVSAPLNGTKKVLEERFRKIDRSHAIADSLLVLRSKPARKKLFTKKGDLLAQREEAMQGLRTIHADVQAMDLAPGEDPQEIIREWTDRFREVIAELDQRLRVCDADFRSVFRKEKERYFGNPAPVAHGAAAPVGGGLHGRAERLRRRSEKQAERRAHYATAEAQRRFVKEKLRLREQRARRRVRVTHKKASAAVAEAHKQFASQLARQEKLIVYPHPGVKQWVRRQPNRIRYLARSSVRKLLGMRLCYGKNWLVANASLAYGTPVVSPHEAYTSGTCIFCFRYHRVGFDGNRYRTCPDAFCPAHGHRVQKDASGALMMFPAAYAQLDYRRRFRL